MCHFTGMIFKKIDSTRIPLHNFSIFLAVQLWWDAFCVMWSDALPRHEVLHAEILCQASAYSWPSIIYLYILTLVYIYIGRYCQWQQKNAVRAVNKILSRTFSLAGKSLRKIIGKWYKSCEFNKNVPIFKCTKNIYFRSHYMYSLLIYIIIL